ncbi:hypothetical protein [Curvibacter lanceolatus]|uniref:hypothetical protein n=1 Tax=Curvibacter lanceolatus TaxID=86182 RepID=UPI0012FAAE3E|nr:hypothetical protein [Curvibacter lanceolatus]
MVSSEFSMVRSLCKWLCENSILLKVHRATNTSICPSVQVGAGEIALHAVTPSASVFSSLDAGAAFALGLLAPGAFVLKFFREVHAKNFGLSSHSTPLNRLEQRCVATRNTR